MTSRKKYIIISLITLLLATIIIIAFIRLNRSTDPDSTGGSGRPQVGRLILVGYDTISNDSSRIPLGDFFTSSQQSTIRSSLEKILFKNDAKKEYMGSVIPGTVTVDHATSIVSFEIEISEPKSTYKVSYNTVSNEISIFDSAGNKLSN